MGQDEPEGERGERGEGRDRVLVAQPRAEQVLRVHRGIVETDPSRCREALAEASVRRFERHSGVFNSWSLRSGE
ncbi:hypothetical protein GCM10010406_38560 [Streptomyces thermolineatus]|uniref:Uncharacterized protein n=1 Tax=Streptomyces thermolineatus TaxID=44033 RepID=A0ABP5ZIS2_9ACTN